MTKTFPVLCAIFIAMSSGKEFKQKQSYFSSPQEAVTKINELLREENFSELASYYDLSDSSVPLDSLTSGQYFLKNSKPERDIPGGFGKFSRPFPLGFSYANHETVDSLITVTVHFEIDQGGGMMQRAIQYFDLRKSENGFQLVAQ